MNTVAPVESSSDRVSSVLEGIAHHWVMATDAMPTVELSVEHVREALVALKSRGKFEQSTLVTAIDHFPAEPRFEVIWQFLSLQHNDRVRVRTRIEEANSGEDTGSVPSGSVPSGSVPSCIDLWPGAAFGERECFDMFGIHFTGHDNLKRLLMPEGYDHFPLRKDFPHQGIQPDRLYREWDEERRRQWDRDGETGTDQSTTDEAAPARD